MKKILLMLLGLVFIGYFIFRSILTWAYRLQPLEGKETIKLPPENFQLSDDILLTDGYYYQEREVEAYSEYSSETGPRLPVENSKYLQKTITPLFLYKNGTVKYQSNGHYIGVDYVNEKGHLLDNYTDRLVDNTFEKCRVRLEEKLQHKENRNKRQEIVDKGVFTVFEHNSKKYLGFQVYHDSHNSKTNLEYYVAEIIDRKTIKIIMKKSPDGEIKDLSILFHYKPFSKKPDSTSFILKNRKEFGSAPINFIDFFR